MQRDIRQLTGRTFDLLVVGGGIYGLTIACDAAGRGLSVALVEGDDFGSGSSFNHLRTIHGGLRYLQTLDIVRARESIVERRTLARIAPHTLRSLPFVLPLERSVMRGGLAMRTGALIDRVVGLRRNAGVPASLRLPPARVLSLSETIERFPELASEGLTGAAVWHDYVTTESDRLTFAWAQAAVERGAVLANHVEATALIVDRERVVGARAVDGVSGMTIEISARLTVNAAGSAAGRLLATAGASLRLPLVKALNLVTNRDAGDEAIGGRSPSGRNLFRVPWRGRAIFGTWESAGVCGPDETTVSEAEIDGFIAEINQAFPSMELKIADVTLVHRGLVPALAVAGRRISLAAHERVRDHSRDALGGLFTVTGAKYTTARAVAERVVDRLLVKRGRTAGPCRTAIEPLPGSYLGDAALAVSAARRELDGIVPGETIPHLVAAYGSRYRDVVAIASSRPDWRTAIHARSPVIGAQLVWAVRREMAVSLADAVIRRTPLGALGYPGDAAAERSAEILGAELHWSAERKKAEIDALRRFYAPL